MFDSALLHELLTPLSVGVALLITETTRYVVAKRKKIEEDRITRNTINEIQANTRVTEQAAKAAQEAVVVVSENTIKTGQIHQMVNGRFTQALNEIAALKARWAQRFPDDEIETGKVTVANPPGGVADDIDLK